MPRIEYNENGDVVLRVVKSINVNFEIINYIYEFMKKNKIPTFSKAVEQIISEHMLYNKLSEGTSDTENKTHETSTEPAETTEPSPTLTGQSIPRSPGGPNSENSENSKNQENEKTESEKSVVLEKSENTRKT